MNEQEIPVSSSNEPGSPIRHVWNPNLYRLQQEAPKPKAVLCTIPVADYGTHYGREFHGEMSHVEAAELLREEGSYLVRLSGGTNGFYTLTFRFCGKLKHYKLYYDGKHYVGEKRFDSIEDLVADGLVTLYIETHAASYIEFMDSINCYESSPYMTLNKLKRRAVVGHSSATFINKEKDYISYQQNSVEVPDGYSDVEYPKIHNFKLHSFKGLNWCEYCGNFLWGFTAQGVKCEDCGFSAHSKCSQKVPNDCCPHLKGVRGVFGIDLTTLVKSRRTRRPFVVDQCVEEIEKRGLDTEGLYRVSGFAEEIEALKLALDTDGENADMGPEKYDNINVIAGTLKLYLRLLPIPLISYEAHPSIIEAAKKQEINEQLTAMREGLKLLPIAHYNTLKFLMEHLERVVQHVEANKMTAHNLSTVFAPTLMPAPDLEKCFGALPGMTWEIAALESLISHQAKIFQ